MRDHRMLLVGILALLVTACGGMRVQHEGELPGRFAEAAPLVVIGEPELTYGADPTETFARATHLVDGFTAAGVPTVAPWELDVSAGQDWPHGRRAVVALLGQHEVDTARAVVARLVVEHEGATRAVLTPASMGGGVRVYADVDVTVRLELSDPNSREVLHTVTVTYREDATRPGGNEFDLRPMLREAITRAAEEAARELLAARGLHQVDVALPTLRWGAWHAMEYGGGVGDSERVRLGEFDELDAEVARYNVYRRYDADVDSDLVNAWERDGGGLLVVQPGPWTALSAGDRIVAVDGDPAAGRHVLLRAAIRGEHRGPIELDVVGPNGRRIVEVRPEVRRTGPGASP